MSRKTTHVTHNGERGGWDIKQGGGERSSAHFPTKEDAVGRAREISQNIGSELIIHNLNGRISQCDSHGKDPYPPKG